MSTVSDAETDRFYTTVAPYYDNDYKDMYGGKDIVFYRELALGSRGPVLEMGCGTGRVLLPLARAGVTLTGMDNSVAMLEQLRMQLGKEDPAVRERVTIVRADIRTDDVGVRFPLIFSAGNVMHTFLERGDQRAWLANVRRHLAPQGEFCFDLFQFDYSRLSIPADRWDLQFDGTDSATGARMRRYVRCRHEPELQRFRVDFRWVAERDGKPVSEESGSIAQRWFTHGELECLLELEGFSILDFWGGYEREPFGLGSTQQIVRARVR